MKKYMPGFVPVNYKKVGKILFALGLILVIADLVFKLGHLLYIGGGAVLISLYLMFVTPKE